MKKGHIWNIHKQITQWNQSGNAIAYFMKGRIADFYKEYRIQLDSLVDQLNKLKIEYYEFDGDQIRKDDAGNMVLKEGKTDYSFNVNFEMLMAQEAGAKFTSVDYPEPAPVFEKFEDGSEVAVGLETPTV